MPVIGEQFKRSYPGLVPIEAKLWRAFVQQYGTTFDSFAYDVHIGTGAPLVDPPRTGDAAFDARMEAGWISSTQSKVDVAARRGNELWIIEVKQRANKLALGQLISYEAMYPETFPHTGPIKLACVCREVAPGMLQVFEDQGILVYQLEPIEPPPQA